MKKTWLIFVIILIYSLGVTGIAGATLINDSVTINVVGAVSPTSSQSLNVTNSTTPEFSFISEYPDEELTFNIEDYYIDVSLYDLTSGLFMWINDGSVNDFQVDISSLDTGFSSGIAGLFITGNNPGLVNSYNILSPTSIRLNIYNVVDFSGYNPPPNSFRVNLSASPVPEPATMILFGIGLLGLTGINRKRK